MTPTTTTDYTKSHPGFETLRFLKGDEAAFSVIASNYAAWLGMLRNRRVAPELTKDFAFDAHLMVRKNIAIPMLPPTSSSLPPVEHLNFVQLIAQYAVEDFYRSRLSKTPELDQSRLADQHSI